MPLVYQQNINEATTLGVWHITEKESFFLEKVSPQQQIRHPHKRLQHLAGRYLLKVLKPDFPVHEILVESSGKPFLKNYLHHFSISHCGCYAAVLISQKEKVGIDIETPDRRIINIKNKFTSDEELSVFSNENLTTVQKLTIIWSIKEAMYKWYGEGMLDFKKHLIIGKYVSENLIVKTKCSIIKKVATELTGESMIFEDFILTHVTELV